MQILLETLAESAALGEVLAALPSLDRRGILVARTDARHVVATEGRFPASSRAHDAPAGQDIAAPGRGALGHGARGGPVHW